MKEIEKKVHYGEEIEKRLKEYGMSKAEFARRIGRCRSDVYNIFKRETIDIKLLQTISKALDYDFIKII